MKRIKRILAAALVMALALLPIMPAQAVKIQDPLRASVEEHIRAFADSIYYAGADDDAAWALALHGVSSRSTLHAEESHPLTATLYNANYVQHCLVETLTGLVEYLQKNQTEVIYAQSGIDEYAGNRRCSTRLYADAGHTEPLNWLSYSEFEGMLNNFDTSLEWMVGHMSVSWTVQRVSVEETTATYTVTIKINDRFDFRGDNGSISKDLLSLLGSVLFREFDWETTVNFVMTVPNRCDHAPGTYHLFYDPVAEDFVVDTSGDFAEIATERIPVIKEETLAGYYYKLDTTVSLLHDQPWVMEYDVVNQERYIMTDLVYGGGPVPIIVYNGRSHIFFYVKEFDEEGQIINWLYFGTALQGKFQFNTTDMYTFRMENVIAEDGSNMIYLTVYNKSRGELVLDRTPMNDRYANEGRWVLKDEEDNSLSGYDILFNYISNPVSWFNVDQYDLRIWENGQDALPEDYLIHGTTTPDCVSQGYDYHTCPDCGYSTRDNFVDSLGHDHGEWVITEAPTCTEGGLERRDCSRCEDFEVREIAATGHIFGDWIVTREATMWATGEQVRYCEGCGLEERVKTPKLDPPAGDATCDGLVNVRDVILLRQFLAGWDVEIHNAGDANGDGKINVKDVILLRQYLAGWDVQLGVS